MIWRTRDDINCCSANGDFEKQKKSKYDSSACLFSAARDRMKNKALFSSIEAKRRLLFQFVAFCKGCVLRIYIRNASRFDFRLSVQYSW